MRQLQQKMANSVDPDQTVPIGSGSTLFVSILIFLNSVSKKLLQTTEANGNFKLIFSGV